MPKRHLKSVLTELDSLVLNIELTLISITQGVALYFLIDNARTLLTNRQYLLWPYVLMGLLIILIFWSRSIMHTLTLIRWPIAFAHNFLYISSTLIEAVTFTQLAQPERWYALNALYAMIIWILFLFDLRLIRQLREDGEGPAEEKLCRIVEKDQWINIRFLVPATIFFNAAAASITYLWPNLFLEQKWHLAFIFSQLFSALVYLFYSIRFFKKVAPFAEMAREEWEEK